MFLSSAADIWSCKTRSSLAVSVHYIDSSDFTLKSLLIACKQFPGTHNAYNTAQLLNSIYRRFELDDKIVATTTDNGGEFRAGFRDYGINNTNQEAYLENSDEPIDIEDISNHFMNSEDENECEESSVNIVDENNLDCDIVPVPEIPNDGDINIDDISTQYKFK